FRQPRRTAGPARTADRRLRRVPRLRLARAPSDRTAARPAPDPLPRLDRTPLARSGLSPCLSRLCRAAPLGRGAAPGAGTARGAGRRRLRPRAALAGGARLRHASLLSPTCGPDVPDPRTGSVLESPSRDRTLSLPRRGPDQP